MGCFTTRACRAGQPAAWPLGWRRIAGFVAVGFTGYSVSIALFVVALRHLEAVRTGGYFSTAPFLGAFASVIFHS
jgi:drug/metabolite transporter (DMT)-like permease